MESQNEEDLIIEAMNNLGDINISSDDIDISHSIPTKRRDGKSIYVVKFISRKKKIAILNAQNTRFQVQRELNLY